MPSAEHRARAVAGRLGQNEEAYLLAEQALGIAAPMQLAWVLETDPGVDAIVALTDTIAAGWLDRSVRRRHVPVARHRWVPATGPAVARLDAGVIADDEVHEWTVAHMESTALPVVGDRGWQVASTRTESGGRVISVIASHVLADGARLLSEVGRAASGRSSDPIPAVDPSNVRAQWREDVIDAAAQARAAGAAITRLVRARRPDAPPAEQSASAGDPPHRDRPAAHMSFVVDAAQWNGVASRHRGTANSLFAAIIGGIAQRAGVSDGPTTISVAVDRRGPDTVDVANTAAGVWIRCSEALGPGAGLAGVRALTKAALTADTTTASADDITTIARTLPRPILARAMAAIGAPDASVSNLGTLAPGSFTVGGVRASTVLARAAARPLTAAMRRDCVPAIAGWMIGHGEHLTVSICAAHPDHLGVGSDTDELVLAEFDRWGLNAHRWGEWLPQIGDTDSHVGEQPSDER